MINYKINKQNKGEENNNINSKKTYINNFNNNLKKVFRNYSSRMKQKKYIMTKKWWKRLENNEY